MAFATDTSGPHNNTLEHIITAAQTAIFAVKKFRSARNSMATPGDLTRRELDSFVLNGNNIERLALKIGFGV